MDEYHVEFKVLFRLKVKAESEAHALVRAQAVLIQYGDRLYGLNTPDSVVHVKQLVNKQGDMEVRVWDG
jgi:hypothetical protein